MTTMIIQLYIYNNYREAIVKAIEKAKLLLNNSYDMG